MKVSDYVAQFLKTKVSHVFGVQGGAAVHLFDSCEESGLECVYHHHEQGAGFAAVGYALVHGYGVCITTTGPGASNALTPLLGAWQGSIPMMFISGQTRAEHTSYKTAERQIGTQEAPILDIVGPIVKAGFFAYKPKLVKYMLEDAYRASVSGRPGPVWIDLPVDVSWSQL